MSEGFHSFNSTEFYDCNTSFHEDEKIGSYSEIDHENVQSRDPFQDPLTFRNSEEYQTDEDVIEFYSPLKATPRKTDDYDVISRKKPRRSKSLGNLILLNNVDDIIETKANKAKEDGTFNCAAKKCGSAQNLSQGRYVTMAGAEKKLQRDALKDFRTRPKLAGVSNKFRLTVPQSPVLLTKTRGRSVKALSREDLDKLEYEEAQKFKIKAKPLNKKILQGPSKLLVPLEKKSTTVVQPFNITGAQQKVAGLRKENISEFYSKPVPKTAYEPPKLKQIKKKKLTKPQTPTVLKRYIRDPVRPQDSQEKAKANARPGRTIPVPFSFERRDQRIQKKKEEFIKKCIEDEKRAREFYTCPIPKTVLRSGKSNSNL